MEGMMHSARGECLLLVYIKSGCAKSVPSIDVACRRLGQECQPAGFPTQPPDEALFDPKKVVIVSNGRQVRLSLGCGGVYFY